MAPTALPLSLQTIDRLGHASCHDCRREKESAAGCNAWSWSYIVFSSASSIDAASSCGAMLGRIIGVCSRVGSYDHCAISNETTPVSAHSAAHLNHFHCQESLNTDEARSSLFVRRCQNLKTCYHIGNLSASLRVALNIQSIR